MAYVVPDLEQTREDQRLYTTARMTEVACRECAVRVRVKKNSEHHTSVQWAEGGPETCPELARLAGHPGGRKPHQTCPRLLASIDAAVQDGLITIGAEDGW